MNKIYTQYFTFASTHEISLSDSIIDDGNYVLEITNLEDKKDYQRLELTKEEVIQLHKLTGLFQEEVDKEVWKKSDMLYVMGHDPYKDVNWSEQISKMARHFEPCVQDRFNWKISDFPTQAVVLSDCNLESNNEIILDRNWYKPGYFLAIRNFDMSNVLAQVIEKKEINEIETLYRVIDVNNAGIWIYAGAKVITDYIDPDTEQINLQEDKDELEILQLHTTDKYLGKGGKQIEFTVQTDSKNLRVTSLLRTEWVDLPLLRIIKIEEGLYKIKKITCVLQTGDMNAYIPDEILDPNTQVNRDTIPLEIINFEQ